MAEAGGPERAPAASVWWAVLALALTLWLFGPATIYYTNVLEFNYQFVWVVPGLAAALLLTGGALGAGMLLLGNGRTRAVALVLALAGLLWLQGTFLVWNYGPLDGREIPWGRMWQLGLIDGLVWLGAIVGSQLRPAALAARARPIAFSLIVLQTAWLGWLVARAPKVPSFQHYLLDESRKYTFSAERNAVVLLLDTFQSDIFQELVGEEPRWRELFRGFTYYRNATSCGAKTFTAVPGCLTGRAYDNSRPLLDFIESAYLAPASLPRRLGASGYRVELYPYPGTEKTIFFSDRVAANFKPRTSRRVLAAQLGLLLDISLFRQLPHVVKPAIYNRQNWLLKRLLALPPGAEPQGVRFPQDARFSEAARSVPDVLFISQMLASAGVAGGPPVFKYFHLNGMHRPLLLDERLEYHPMSANKRENFKIQARASLEITRLFLEELKRLGVFDNALLVVMGDHGSADYPFPINLAAAGLREESGGRSRIQPQVKASALPMLLIKMPQAGDRDLQINDAPVVGTDLPRTLVTALGLDPRGMPGQDMPAVPLREPRERRFFYYNWNGWGDMYLYSMHEYAVNGHAWLDGSWREIGVRRPGNSGEAYAYGTVLRFHDGGNSMPYLGVGWYAPQKEVTWTREKRVEMFFTVKPPRGDLLLKMIARPFLVKGRLDEQIVEIEVNGRFLKRLVLRDPNRSTLRALIPRDWVHGGTLRLVFNLPNAAAPADLGHGDDIRFLGLAVQALVLADADRVTASDLAVPPAP